MTLETCFQHDTACHVENRTAEWFGVCVIQKKCSGINSSVSIVTE